MRSFVRYVVFAALTFFAAGSSTAQVFVDGYERRDGTYVQPHYRSNPDGIRWNNWSCCGNVNPYTGERSAGRSTPRFTSPSWDDPYSRPTPRFRSPHFASPRFRSLR